MKTLHDLSQALEKIIKHYYSYHYKYESNQTAEPAAPAAPADNDDFEVINITHSLETCVEHLVTIKQKRASLLDYLYHGIQLIAPHINTTRVLEEQEKQLLQQQLAQFIVNLQKLLKMYETESVTIKEKTQTFQIIGLVNVLCSGSGMSRSGLLISEHLFKPLFSDSKAPIDNQNSVINWVIGDIVNTYHTNCLVTRIKELEQSNNELKQKLAAPKPPLPGHFARPGHSVGLFSHFALTFAHSLHDLAGSIEEAKKEPDSDTPFYLFDH